jgi:DegV family protein with EDD domain
MTKIAIITDSSAYMPQSLVEQYGLHIVPLMLTLKGISYRDGIDIQASEFYKLLAQSDEFPTTSQTNVFTYEELFAKLLDEGKEILALPISAGISASMQSALEAKVRFPGAPIEIVDTQLVSMALTFQVLAVARAAEKGASLAECRAAAEEAYSKIGVYFTVETLKYLYMGGRIGSAKHLFGTALKIKPILMIREGKIELVESVVTHRKAIRRMVELVETDIAGRKPVRISVFHAGVPETAQKLLDEVSQRFGAEESILSEVSPAVGSHTGPGTLSIAYMAG